jgi:hypothetical protein
LDWCVTCYFYAAIHYVSIVLIVQGPAPTSHEKRDPLVKHHPNLKNIWNEYKSLDIKSRNARYYCTDIEPADVLDAQLKFDALRAYIRKITGIDKPAKRP